MAHLETYDFEMFSKAGNNACRSLVKKVTNKITGAKRVTQEDITQYCSSLVNKLAEKHGEVYDTEPAHYIAAFVNKSLAEVGYDFKISRYDFKSSTRTKNA
jgi:hypothetical protein